MFPDSAVTSVAHVIQLAVAPVFLLTGVGSILAVLTNRLGRIIDRSRVVEDRLENENEQDLDRLRMDLRTLLRRSRLVNWGISLCTFSALLICLVVAALFVGAFLRIEVSDVIALVFIGAMLSLVGGLITFLGEIYLATGSIRPRAKRPPFESPIEK